MTETAAPAPLLDLALPGEWSTIALESADASAASVRALVRERFGRRDDQAVFRAEQRRAFERATADARRGNATQFVVSGRTDNKVAFGATVIEYQPALILGAGPLDAASVVDAFARRTMAVEAGRELTGDEHWKLLEDSGAAVFEKGDALVVRRDRYASHAPDVPGRAGTPADHDEPIMSYSVDYWITVPGERRLVLLSCSSILAELAPLMLELFDGIVDASTWRRAASETGLRAQLSGRGEGMGTAPHRS